MILLTPGLRARLLANRLEPDADHVPVIRLFNPLGAATWLATEIDEDGDTLFGLADLGFGCPELGYFSLSELSSLRLPFSMGVERDTLLEATLPLSIYATAAREAGSIVAGERSLRAVAASRENKAAEPRPREEEA